MPDETAKSNALTPITVTSDTTINDIANAVNEVIGAINSLPASTAALSDAQLAAITRVEKFFG